MNTDSKNISVLYEMAFGIGTNVESITQSQLVDLIRNADKTGATPISITAVTIPGQRKGGNQFAPIYKVSQINGMIGANYENSVNRKREKEGIDPTFKRSTGWGEHESTSLVSGKNGLSIAIQPTRSNSKRSPTYIGTFGSNFKPLSEEQWKPLVYTANEKKVADMQGIEKSVIYRRVLVSNIAGITINKKEYILSDLDKTKQAVLEAAKLRDADVF